MDHKVYAVSSGSYSDYSVHCIFETEEDAKKYIEIYNLNAAKRRHEWGKEYYAKHHNITNPTFHEEKFEDCSSCRPYREQPQKYGDVFLEEFDFYPKGIIPINEV